MFEYTLLDGVNDRDGDAEKLATLLRDVPCKINLLSVNPVADTAFQSPAAARVLRFQQILRNHGFTVFIRTSRGEDISAACGQLAGKGWDSSKVELLEGTKTIGTEVAN